MPTVKIVSPTVVEPNPVTLTRNDQTIMWQLGEGLKWGSIAPIQFLPGGGMSPGEVPYSNWPRAAVQPAPIDTGVASAERPFWTSANQPQPRDQQEWYRYEILVEHVIDGHARISRVHVQRDGEWYDPDVLNDPQP